MACHVKDNDLNNAVIIITTTRITFRKDSPIVNKPTDLKTFLDILMINKNTELKIEHSLKPKNKIKELIINHSGKVAYVSAERLYSFNINNKQPTLNEMDSSEYIPRGPSYIKSSQSDTLLISFYWPEDAPVYSFTIPSTGNNWLDWRPYLSKIVSISHNGKEAIEINREILSQLKNTIKFSYDDNITQALDYLDTTKTNSGNTPEQIKLLVTLLIHHIIKNHNKLSSKITLDPVEWEIYATHTPQEIKNILEKKYTILKIDQNVLKKSLSDMFSSFGKNVSYYRALALDKFNQIRVRLTKSSVTLPKKINFKEYKFNSQSYKINPAHE